MKGSHGFGLGVALAAVATSPSTWAIDYGTKGAHAFQTTDLPANAGGSTGGKLVVPDEPGVYPLIIASHGWSASAANQVGWGELFASWGFVVVVPSFPNPLAPDFDVDKGIITSLVTMYQSPSTDSPAKGKVDATRLGLEGHSAGGLATTLAAAALKPRATVLFDPVDNGDAGRGAYASFCSPLLEIFANGSSCNNEAEWSTFKTESVGPTIAFNVVGSSHCDGENVDRGAACGLFCGGAADPARQAVYGRYATAFFLSSLNGDSAAAAALTETSLDADAMITGVSVHDAPNCASSAPGIDGGIVSVDAGSTSAGGGDGIDASSHGGGGSDGGADATNGGNGGGHASSESPGASVDSGSSGGCGCDLASTRSRFGAAWGLGAAAIVLARVRRRRKARR